MAHYQTKPVYGTAKLQVQQSNHETVPQTKSNKKTIPLQKVKFGPYRSVVAPPGITATPLDRLQP